MNNNKIYSDIISKLRSTRRKESWIITFTGLFNALAISISILFLAVIVEMFAHGDQLFRGSLASFVLFSFVIFMAYFLAPGVSRFLLPKKRPALSVIALRVGDKYPDVKDRLCNAVQIYKTMDSPHGMSKELIEAAFTQITDYSKDKNFDVILEKRKLKKSFFYFVGSLLIFMISLLAFPSSLGASLERINNWDKSYIPPAPFSISIDEAKQTVIRGTSATIIIKAEGTPPDVITLHIKEEQQKVYDEYVLRLDSGNIYRYEIASTKSPLVYYASAKWLNSNIITSIAEINVIDLPQVRSMTGRVAYPSYTGLSPRQFDEQSADISALHGSSVELNVLSNKSLKSARIVLEKSALIGSDSTKTDTSFVNMTISEKQARGTFRCNFNGTYHIELIDTDNQSNREPIKYAVVSGNDGFPTITMISPMMNVEVSRDAILPIRASIGDDYGFSSLKLHYRLTESKYAPPQTNFRSINIPLLSSGGLSQDIPYVWNLNAIGISPDDKYEFYLEVFDNDIVSGPKSSRTQTLSVRLPSADEVVRQSDKVHEQVGKELENIIKESDRLKKDMEALNRELLKKNNQKEVNWKERRAAEDAMKRQAELKERLSNVSEQLQDATNKMQQNNLMSPETLQKYMELQQLMQQVQSPELERMQRQMERAMQNMPQDQLQKAIEEAKFDEERFRKSIERTMKILKRLQAEQKADALSKRAEDLQQRQESLDKQTQNTNPNDKQKADELARTQDMLKQELNAMNKDLQELENLMKEIGENEMPMKELSDAQKSLDFNETQKEMSESTEAMKSGDMKKSSQNQKKAAEKLKDFSQKMQGLKQKMQENVSREAQRQMQRALQNMLETSKKQEDLRGKTQRSDFNSTQIPEFTSEQGEHFESLNNIANSLAELGEKSFAVTPQMGAEITNSLRQMRSAINHLADRQMSQAANAQLQAMRSMNSTISQMQSMISQMQNQESSCDEGSGGAGSGQGQASGGMGLMQRLEQMAAEQQAINQGMQQMASGEGGSMSQEQRAQMGRLADKQGNAQKSIEEMAREQKEMAGGDKQTLGDLNKIAEEMQEVAHDIRTGNISAETRRKQERILSRLLDATKSMHDRDFEAKREGQTGRQFNRLGPNAIDFNDFINRNQAMQDILDNARRGYTKDYENIIRKYFEAIRQNKNAVGN